MRPTARLTLTILLAALTALVAGCGSDDTTDSKTSGAERAASTKADESANGKKLATVDATLDIKLTNVASKDFAGIPVPAGVKCTRSSPATCHGTLECPASAEEAEKFELCSWLATTGSKVLLTKEDPAQMCTEQYGGPEVATVTGTIGDDKVNATFTRENGCAIGRFDEASPLWTGEVPDASTPVDGPGGAAAGSCPAMDPDAPVSSDATPPPAADSAADAVCATPAAPTSVPTPAPGTPLVEPEIISDPPEAFER